MIEEERIRFTVKLEDFEGYRKDLLEYSSGLLRTRGFSNHKHAELDELSKDIVQNTYLRFHSHVDDYFVTKQHFWSFLKTCLYREYLDMLDFKRRGAQYMLFKLGEFDQLDVTKHPKIEAHDFDYINGFKPYLTENQLSILNLLLEGYNKSEVAVKAGVSKQAINESVNYIKTKYFKYESKSN